MYNFDGGPVSHTYNLRTEMNHTTVNQSRARALGGINRGREWTHKRGSGARTFDEVSRAAIKLAGRLHQQNEKEDKHTRHGQSHSTP